MNKLPNIILLIVDTLRHDRLGISGHVPAVTPNLDRLVAAGLSCPFHFANGCVTQVAFPAMFTSTLPFDYGGYNEGIVHRPDSFAEHLREAGYETFALITGHPASSHFGYDRGFDDFVDLIDLYQWFRSIFKTMLRELFERWQAGRLSDEEMFDLLAAEYGRCLVVSERYIHDMETKGLPSSGRSRSALLKALQAERDLLARNPRAVCEKLMELDQDYQFALGDIAVTDAMRRRFRRRDRLRGILNRRLMLSSDRRAFEAPVVNRLFDQFLQRRDRAEPFFALLHYFDLHEAKMLLSNWSLEKAARLPRALARARSGRDREQRGLLYDITLSMVDSDVGVLRRNLDRHGLSENTILVITGDHGADAGPPGRGIQSDMSHAFYDEYLRVPLIVHGPGIEPEEMSSLVSQLDLAPTILELAGVEPPSSFQGLSIFRRRQHPAPFTWSENAGNGRCDFMEKPLFFGIRTKSSKSIFEAHGFTAREREFYDLEDDPLEQRNLADTDKFIGLRTEHLALVQRRLDTIFESLGDQTGASLGKSA